MSEHAWVHENLAAFVAGGLDAAEAERVEAHVAACESCAAALDDARALDSDMDALFAAARPEPALEDRMIQALRAAPRRFRPLPLWGRKLAWGAAATVALGATGAAVSQFGYPRGLPLPGSAPQGEPLAEVAALTNPPTEKYYFPPRKRNDEGFALGNDWGDVDLDGGKTPDNRPFDEQDNLYGHKGTPEGSMSGRGPASTMYMNPSLIQDSTSNTIINGSGFGETGKPSGQTYWKHLGGGAGIGGLGGGGLGGLGGGLGGMGGGGLSGMMGGPGMGMMGGSPGASQTGSVQTGGGKGGEGKSQGQGNDVTIRGKYGWGKAQNGDEGREQTPLTAPGSTPPSVTYFVPDDHRAKVTDKRFDVSGRDIYKADDAKTKAKEDGPEKTKPQRGASGGTGSGPGQVDKKPAQPAPEKAATRKVIRSGDIEFEVKSFDSAAAGVTKLVTAIKGAFIATINNEKLPNGKVKGSLVVRVPPDALDGLVLDLRQELGKDGELKGLRLGSQDVTKQYYDLESRLKAAKTMQDRLLKMIQDGKGEIKQLLEAEKELGVWRTKIEEFEGEIRYYNNLTALSTLTITLAEKSISSAVDMVEHEVVDTGIEVEDVDKAREETLTAVADAKGRVIKAEMKHFAAGQYNATLNFEVPADKTGEMRDRLKQLGTTARLEINRTVQAVGGQATRDAKTRRGDTIFAVSLYNVTAMAVRETTTVQLAAPDVPAAYRALQDAVAKVTGRVVTAQLNEQDRNNITADLKFEVRRADVPAVQDALTAAGEIVTRNVVRAEANQNLTDAKVQFQTRLYNAAAIPPREGFGLRIEVPDVDTAAALFAAEVKELGGRIVSSETRQEPAGHVQARFIYNVPLASAPGLVERIKRAGNVRSQESVRNPQAPDGRLAVGQIVVTLTSVEPIVAKDDGLWPQVRTGLSTSVRFLLFSLSWIIFGVLFVLPWAVLLYFAYRLVRWLFRSPATPAPAAAAPAA